MAEPLLDLTTRREQSSKADVALDRTITQPTVPPSSVEPIASIKISTPSAPPPQGAGNAKGNTTSTSSSLMERTKDIWTSFKEIPKRRKVDRLTASDITQGEIVCTPRIIPPATDLNPSVKIPTSIPSQTSPITSGTNDVASKSLGELTAMITISDEAKKKETAEHDELMEWIGARRMVLDGLKEITNADNVLSPFRALFGFADSVLKMMESVETSDKSWNEMRDAIQRHLMYVKNEIEGNEDVERVASNLPRMKFLKEYALELRKVFEAYLCDRGLSKDELCGKKSPIVAEYAKELGRFFKKAGRVTLEIQQIRRLRDDLTEALQNYERNKTTHISDAVDQLLYAEVEKLLAPANASTQPCSPDEDTTPSPSPYGRQHNECHPGTRAAVLSTIDGWARHSGVPSLYVLSDFAGIGKSTVAYTLARRWRADKILMSAFFFSRGTSGISTAFDLVRHLAAALISHNQVRFNPELTFRKISDVLKLPSVDDQWGPLVQHPISLLAGETMITGQPLLIVIDAFGECSKVTRRPFLQLLTKMLQAGVDSGTAHVKVLLTTRPEADIKQVLDAFPYSHFDVLENHPLDHGDVRVYVKYKFDLIGLSHTDADALSRLSDRLFIFAKTACTILDNSPAKTLLLKEILNTRGLTHMEKLHDLYRSILELKTSIYDVHGKKASRDVLCIILGATRPLSISEIETLLTGNGAGIMHIIGDLSSVLGGGYDGTPVYVRHPTFRDFMLDSSLSGEYSISAQSAHHLLTSSCLLLLLRDLHSNMFEISPDTSFSDVGSVFHPTRRLEDHVDSAVLYAALAWTFHAVFCLKDGKILASIGEFFKTKLLNWIELGAIDGHLPEFMRGIHRLESALGNVAEKSDLAQNALATQWCLNTLAFIRTNQVLLQRLPLHVYSSALMLAPQRSLLHQTYEPHFRTSLPKVISGHSNRALSLLLLTGHEAEVQSAAYSTDGELLVSAAGHGIIVWDGQTGAKLWGMTFEGWNWSDECIGITFMPTQHMVVLIWSNGKVYRLNCETRTRLCPPEEMGLGSKVTCVAWAPGSTSFLCGAADGYIHPFTLGAELRRGTPIRAHDGRVTSLSFSHDGCQIASTSDDETIKIWEVTSEVVTGRFAAYRHTNSVYHGEFSPMDSSLFAFTDGGSVYVRDIDAGITSSSLNCGINGARRLAYSHDGNHIYICPRHGNSIRTLRSRVRNQDSEPVARELHTGHIGNITCFSLSPDNVHLATGATDQDLRIHDLLSTTPQPAEAGHQWPVHSMSFNFDGKRLASAAGREICLWNTESGKLIQDNIWTSGPVVALSSDGSVVAWANLSNDIQLCCVGYQNPIHPKISLGYSSPGFVSSMVFSPDDAKLVVITDFEPALIIDVQSMRDSPVPSSIAFDLDHSVLKQRLAYHPSGNYICYGDEAWDLANRDPIPITGEHLDTVLAETFPLIQFDAFASPSPAILNTYTDEMFYLPLDFKIWTHATHDGLIALGTEYANVILLDFRRLCVEEEAFITRIGDMRRATATRLGPSRLHELLVSYSGPEEMVIPVVAPTQRRQR